MTESIPKVSETVPKIKSRGFWEVTIHPLKFEKERIKSLSDCKEMIEKSKVQFRGWDYPHISNKYGIRSETEWVENLTDWSEHIEYWRMYKSAQFYHIFSCREDWWGPVRIFWSQQPNTSPGYGLEFLCTIFTLTEIYEFAARLVRAQIFGDLIKITITLNRMKDRRLVTTQIRRSLSDYFVCNLDTIPLERTVAVDELVGRSKEFAIDDVVRVFESFNWFKPPRKVFEEEQDKLIRRIF